MPTAPIARPDSGSGTASGMPASGVHSGSCVRTARAIGWSSARSTGSGPYVPCPPTGSSRPPCCRTTAAPAAPSTCACPRTTSTTSSGRVAPDSAATRWPNSSAERRARRSAASSPARCRAWAHWSARVVAVARSSGPGARDAVKQATATPRQCPRHHQRQAREPGVAVLLQRGPLRRVPVAPLGVVGEPHLLRPGHRVRHRIAGVERHALPALAGPVRPVLHPQAQQDTVAQLPRRNRLDVEQLPQLGDHDGADLRRCRGRRQRRGGVLQQPEPVVGRAFPLRQPLALGLGPSARGDVAADGLHPAGPRRAHAQLERDPGAVPPPQVPHLGARATRPQHPPQRRQPRLLAGTDEVAHAQREVLVVRPAQQRAGRRVRGEEAAVVVGEPDPDHWPAPRSAGSAPRSPAAR